MTLPLIKNSTAHSRPDQRERYHNLTTHALDKKIHKDLNFHKKYQEDKKINSPSISPSAVVRPQN